MSNPELDIAGGAIGALAKLVEYIAKASGQSEAEVLAEVEADVKARAKNPTDESDAARSEIEADLPE